THILVLWTLVGFCIPLKSALAVMRNRYIVSPKANVQRCGAILVFSQPLRHCPPVFMISGTDRFVPIVVQVRSNEFIKLVMHCLTCLKAHGELPLRYLRVLG